MRKLTPILLGTLLFLSVTSVLEVQALLPTFLYYSISNTAPDITQPVTISVELDFVTDEGEDISSIVGPLSVLLHWSRDKDSWASDSMTLIAGNYHYRSIIPRQDGYTNSKYDFGSGPCYWYIEIKNNLGESDTKYSISEPNDEIYFLDYSGGQTVVIGEETSPDPNDLGQVFNQFMTETFGSNPFNDPYIQIILVIMTAVVVIIIATRGGGQRTQNLLSKLFRFGKR